MVDAHALGACGFGRAGSNPASPTTEPLDSCTDCIRSEETEEDCGAFRSPATGGSPSGLRTATHMTSISSTTTDEERPCP